MAVRERGLGQDDTTWAVQGKARPRGAALDGPGRRNLEKQISEDPRKVSVIGCVPHKRCLSPKLPRICECDLIRKQGDTVYV